MLLLNAAGKRTTADVDADAIMPKPFELDGLERMLRLLLDTFHAAEAGQPPGSPSPPWRRSAHLTIQGFLASLDRFQCGVKDPHRTWPLAVRQTGAGREVV